MLLYEGIVNSKPQLMAKGQDRSPGSGKVLRAENINVSKKSHNVFTMFSYNAKIMLSY